MRLGRGGRAEEGGSEGLTEGAVEVRRRGALLVPWSPSRGTPAPRPGARAGGCHSPRLSQFAPRSTGAAERRGKDRAEGKAAGKKSREEAGSTGSTGGKKTHTTGNMLWIVSEIFGTKPSILL